ncbi:MAG: EI24 domain-containing protein [Rubrivivax sp.]|nr:EI24 domain-containing protein [Rubrivivax sp.]
MTIWPPFWRAIATCLHPRVLLWSLLPLTVAAAAVGLLGWAYWETAIDGIRAAMDSWSMSQTVFQWLHSVGAPQLRVMVAPMVVVVLAVPVVLLLTLLLVAALAAPAVVRLVAARHYPDLQALQGASWAQGVLWSLACTLAALLALALSVPLWLVPPLVMVLPPLIWGWLTCRVMAFDVLSHHASAGERRQVLRSRRWSLLAMGILCGYLGALPSLIWAAGGVAFVLAPLLALVAVWLYTVVFVFAACWFAHFCLGELQRIRQGVAASMATQAAAIPLEAASVLPTGSPS